MMPVFDPERASLVQYCATYNPAPSNASSITAQPCQTVAAANSSQVFLYSPSSGVVHPLWTQDAAVSSTGTASNTSSLFSNSSIASDASVKISNVTSTVITCHPDSHYVTNALLSDPSDANTTAAAAPNGQDLFELVFIPEAAEFLVAPSAPTANITEALAQHIDVVDSHSQSAPPTFTPASSLPVSTMPSPVNTTAVHLAEALLPMIPFPDSADDASSTPAPTPTGRR
ncbi:hypothetical protein CALVIDRAFT_154993 [Calocera viscosa TUFC12733]|uniref:Uncharacterized protein n=1 Tax=Calocera viscosa (strain TUFC12733) TaxID=1330018 RepID=A0A167LNV5_CALVF|nr:hypothetical protein CALVIDRAFT_154993 [Calocera viscosa TUFC12733]